jgi:hypothetical protein
MKRRKMFLFFSTKKKETRNTIAKLQPMKVPEFKRKIKFEK